ncbi:WecB/TagA/CpsF family glycosyltransferase [Nesterenkonia marinintestina]|uniref:WecB/TagA/CpsF family glycosyltransferase n=1 Tax=Nesterenkonia marinintestina TaxID=2979865 RepID=UPI0021BEACBA|nr:WecB/TagA/CpsF family glycosyltransferase [Nesterenkonia sp. GX14115]
MTLTRRVPVFDIDVTPLTLDQLLSEICDAVDHGGRLMVAGHNLHSVYLSTTDDSFRRFYERTDIKLIDGMPVLAALNLGDMLAGRGATGVSHRLGSTDWIRECDRLHCVRRVAVLGAPEPSNSAAVEHMAGRSRHVEYLGIPGHPWDERRLPELLGRLQDFDPQVLFVGMGMPLQESIAVAVADGTRIPVIATVGGAVDQISGAQSLAPRWLGRTGFEWAWRLASDPRRFAGRYLVEPVRLARALLARRTA